MNAAAAGAAVPRPGPQLQDAGNDVFDMQPTRQNEPTPDVCGKTCRNERPIEDLSRAAEPRDVSVEEEALGLAKAAREV